jgi:hypothetical protein
MYLNPEFAALLQNNNIPSELTILEVTESLKAPLNELEEVEAEIQRLRKLMKAMKAKRQGIQKIINDHNIILAPARRLPPDVLHEIFFHCLPTRHNPIMKYSESPLLLTRICNSWRAIALSSPRIWSKIHIPLPGDPSLSESCTGIITDEPRLSNRRQRFARVLQLRCDIVRRWLSRAGTCPLSLSITYPSYFLDVQDLNDELTNEMFDILLSYADRWEDVDLFMPEAIYNKLQSNINPTMFSFLKSLKINLCPTLFAMNNAQSIPIRLLAAPGLRKITLDAMLVTLHFPESPIQPNWTHITHITFVSSTDDRYLLILLRQCPNLVFGNFQVLTSWSDESIMDQDEVLLPHLESLAIDDSGAYGTMTIIFNAIKAPALTRLSYQGFKESHLGDNSAISLPIPVLPLLENSTLINDLSLDGGLSSQDTRECLQRGARVTRIVFGKPPHANAPRVLPDTIPPDIVDLRILSIGSLDLNPLPRLESLEAHQLSNLTDEDLLDVITSRINASKQGETAALKSVKISFQRPRQKDITEDVSRIAKEAGIEVKLDLTYLPEEGFTFLKRLSPSFGLTLNNVVAS